MLNYDILEIIFNNFNSINDIFNFRLVNKQFDKIFKDEFKKINVDIISRCTFINFKECYVCCNKFNNVKQLIYKYDSLPHKCILHCTQKYCYLMSIKRYLSDIKNNNIYPFCYIEKKNLEKFKINNNLTTNFYIESLRKYNGKWYIKYDYEKLYKQKYIKLTDIILIKNLNLFNWYLKRNY